MPKHLNQAHFCDMCSCEHEFTKELCPRCGMCFKLCVRADEQCKWFDPPTYTTPIPSSPDAADVIVQANELPAYESLKGAFESWLLSSGLEQGHEQSICTDEHVAFFWKDFETFAREVLTPVDSEKIYLQIDSEHGIFKTLDAKKLYRNQDGDYVILEDKRRIRIGRLVAVM